MKLTYINYKNCKNKNLIKEIYVNSFPKDERYPFWIIKSSIKNENIIFNIIYEETNVIGFLYSIFYDNNLFLWYLAIDKKYRNKGYGKKVISDLKNSNKYKNIILAVEKTDESMNKEDIRVKRKEFYIKNGFYETNTFTEDRNVEYEMLCTNKNFNITEKLLKNVYKQMAKSICFGSIIEKIYNIDYVHII